MTLEDKLPELIDLPKADKEGQCYFYKSKIITKENDFYNLCHNSCDGYDFDCLYYENNIVKGED